MHFLANELSRWDALTLPERGEKANPPEALVLGIFVDERPLRGAAGLADWRLSGRLSRLCKKERLSGKQGEALLVPPAGGRLPFARLLIFGLGEQRGFGEGRYSDAVAKIRKRVHDAGVRRYAVQPPGRSNGLIAPRRALELWLEAAEKDGLGGEVTIIESPSGQKEMLEALRAARRSA